MSQDLPGRVKALRTRLSRIRDLEGRVREAGSLDDLRADLAKPIAALKAQLDQGAILTAGGITVDLPPAVAQGRRRAAALLEAFSADRSAAALKKGRAWTQLLSETTAASEAIASSVKAAWRSHQQAVFGGDAPATIKSRLAKTPENNAALATYETKHQAFRQAFETLPTDVAAVRRVHDLARELQETAKAFDFNVPPAVKRFLEAVQAEGASLALLTDEVTAWLKERNAFDDYHIRAVDRR